MAPPQETLSSGKRAERVQAEAAPGGGRYQRRRARDQPKQACNRRVQSSSPCDGSSPYVKRVAHNTRCTFVKFDRQTAPVGPGHPSSLAPLPSSSPHYPVPRYPPTLPPIFFAPRSSCVPIAPHPLP
ncbi:hypothetical protein B0H19DRAFT_82940 [Mycena capillaripes]|nr:hypothetical protein B0H19DRAFT_82940 [Mycena capillaripes]